MEQPSIEMVYQAISALHENPNGNEKEKASVWLADMQKSIHSWKIADELLQQKKDVNSCYFAAQTMRSKVQHNLTELSTESLISLRNTLIEHLKGISPETSGAILTQLCLALADLALQMAEWKNSVGDFIESFSNSNHYALIEILTVLPQEIDSSNLKLGENRREEIKTELKASSNIVMLYLKESITNFQSTATASKVIKCMTSWLQVKAVNLEDIPNNNVIGFCMQILRNYNSINVLHDSATDCICALLHSLDNRDLESVERLLFDGVSSLEESYHMAVAHEEDEKATNYARIFTELAETFLEKIVSATALGNVHFAMRSLELALICVGHHDYEIAEITFNLWYRLSEEIYQRDYDPLTDAFKPHIERLIEALARHCQCEPDNGQPLEEGDEFFEFRNKVVELIKDVVFIVGSAPVFRQMFSAIDPKKSWAQTEAALFVMQAVAKNVLPEEYEYVPKVVQEILSMPAMTSAGAAHPAVRKTCITLLGELCEWIEWHPECLQQSLEFLIMALEEPKQAVVAAQALQNICKSCRREVGAHTGRLLAAARGAHKLSPPAAIALMRALAAAIGTLPHDQLSVVMREAVSLQLSGLSALMKQDLEIKKNTSSDPAVWLDRLAALFRDVDPAKVGDQHPCLPALVDAWPVIHETMNKYQKESRIMERACRALRFAVRCTGRHASPLLPPLSTAMAAIYASHSHSCLLYLASILVDELAHDPGNVDHLVGLLQALMPRAFELLQQTNGLKDNPDTVDDLFRLCIRFMQRTPLEFLQSGAMPAVVRCAALASPLDHREANASVMRFLHDLARAAMPPAAAQSDRPQVAVLADEVLSTYGEELTHALLEACVFHLHPYMLGEVAEVLVALFAWQRAKGRDWLAPAVARLPRPPEAPAGPTQHQCYQFHHYGIRTEKCKEMTRLLREFVKLYR